jgi:hypothetical protein
MKAVETDNGFTFGLGSSGAIKVWEHTLGDIWMMEGHQSLNIQICSLQKKSGLETHI